MSIAPEQTGGPQLTATEHQPSSPCRPRPGAGGNGAAGGVYGLGLIGAAVFYIQHADTFWEGALGLLKALVWPAFMVYDALDFLGS